MATRYEGADWPRRPYVFPDSRGYGFNLRTENFVPRLFGAFSASGHQGDVSQFLVEVLFVDCVSSRVPFLFTVLGVLPLC